MLRFSNRSTVDPLCVCATDARNELNLFVFGRIVDHTSRQIEHRIVHEKLSTKTDVKRVCATNELRVPMMCVATCIRLCRSQPMPLSCKRAVS